MLNAGNEGLGHGGKRLVNVEDVRVLMQREANVVGEGYAWVMNAWCEHVGEACIRKRWGEFERESSGGIWNRENGEGSVNRKRRGKCVHGEGANGMWCTWGRRGEGVWARRA